MILANTIKRIYSKSLDNWKSLTGMECINKVRDDLPPLVIFSDIQQLEPWYNNNLNSNVAITMTETGFNND